jgi:hypothetical protein
MYSHCLSRFAVGRMLAFDLERGRLWVVCLACRRWNLAPLEERWEAIEEAERLFRDARRRVATEHIGLATLPGNVSLIRVGRAEGPEFAGWRYGSRLFGRWLRAWRNPGPAGSGLGIGTAASLAAAGATTTLGLGLVPLAASALVGVPAGALAWGRLAQRRDESPVCWVWPRAGAPVPVTGRGCTTAELRHSAEVPEGWVLTLLDFDGRREYSGADARRVLAAVLARENRFGAGRKTVESAVSQIEAAGEPDAFFRNAARRRPSVHHRTVAMLPGATRLALEMSVHEAAERLALDGDMARLEAEWREAEQIAEIADGLIVPSLVTEKLRRMKESAGRPG